MWIRTGKLAIMLTAFNTLLQAANVANPLASIFISCNSGGFND